MFIDIHVNFWSRHNYLGFVSINIQLVAVRLVTYYVRATLDSTGSGGEQVGVICNADSSGSDDAKVDAKGGSVEAEECWVDVDLGGATGPHMTCFLCAVLSSF